MSNDLQNKYIISEFHGIEVDRKIIKEALETKKIHPLRYASYTTLLQESPPKDWE